MFLIVLILCVVTSVVVVIRRRDNLSLYLLGMSVSDLLMLVGVIIYIAKMGGLAATEQVFLFLKPEIQRWLLYLPISMNLLGYTVAIGRTLFPYFLLLVALETTMIPWVRQRVRILRLLALIPPVFFLIYFYPPVFRALVTGRFWLLAAMLPVSMVWIAVYLLISLALMVQEYREITIHFFKQNYGTMLLSICSITALYLLYATKDPAQIYNMFIGEYIRLGITSYINPSLSVVGWTILGLCTAGFVIVGNYSMVRYVQLNYEEDQEDVTLQRKFDAAGMGVSVFVHGIKNQLLAGRVVHKKLTRVLDSPQPDLEQVRIYAAQLRELNEGMLVRMDELYRTVKTNALSLSPVEMNEVVDSAMERFYSKYPEGHVEITQNTRRLVLADVGPLGEAVYNLLTNGYEAAIMAGQEPKIELITCAERKWTVLEVRDNGGGIPQEQQARIYDPFFTSKNTSYNWGMGLYYVRKIVRSHWGRLRLESRVGEGSSFFVMLPLFDAEQME